MTFVCGLAGMARLSRAAEAAPTPSYSRRQRLGTKLLRLRGKQVLLWAGLPQWERAVPCALRLVPRALCLPPFDPASTLALYSEGWPDASNDTC